VRLQKVCFASQPGATSSIVFSSSWCRRRSAVSGSLKQPSGGDDCTHRIELRPHLASQQQERGERSFSVALGLPGVREVRPNPSLKGESQRRGTLGLRRPAFGLFCAAVPARHTVGPTLARTLGIPIHFFNHPAASLNHANHNTCTNRLGYAT
jgi:hypothetical protein